jgi:hypothetical protein
MTVNLTTPVGRIVQGDLAKAQPVLDNAGKPKLTHDGKPMIQHFIALAIPKTPGHKHWGETDWGKQVWDEGFRSHPNFAPHPTFSWKIEDGDSAVPNKNGKKNVEREGFPGHWILKLRSGFLPKTYTTVGWVPDGSNPPAIPAEGIRCGYYAQVNCSVAGNTGPSPGVYINPNMVALSGYGEEIIAGPDASEAGFGAAPLPPGASATPLGGFAPAAPVVPGGASVSVPFAPPTPTTTTSPSNVPAPVNPAFLAPPPPPAAKQLTAKANGASYADLIKAGWTDALLVQHGMML